CLRLIILTSLLAHFVMADVSELVKSGNGFLYDLPVNANLPLAPLDLANDEQTLKAFADNKSASKSTIEITIAPSLATSASLKTSVITAPAPQATSIHSSYHNSAKSGYNYVAPVKPFFIA
ncbi:hypothetical protein DOY81_007553, partial [Sarcophaga bullata]